MADEKTLLQQIRDKEEELSRKIDTVKAETDATIAAARTEADKTIRDANARGKAAADAWYNTEMEKTKQEIDQMNLSAGREADAAKTKGERNLPAAVDKIIGYVTRQNSKKNAG